MLDFFRVKGKTFKWRNHRDLRQPHPDMSSVIQSWTGGAQYEQECVFSHYTQEIDLDRVKRYQNDLKRKYFSYSHLTHLSPTPFKFDRNIFLMLFYCSQIRVKWTKMPWGKVWLRWHKSSNISALLASLFWHPIWYFGWRICKGVSKWCIEIASSAFDTIFRCYAMSASRQSYKLEKW